VCEVILIENERSANCGPHSLAPALTLAAMTTSEWNLALFCYFDMFDAHRKTMNQILRELQMNVSDFCFHSKIFLETCFSKKGFCFWPVQALQFGDITYIN
jgi:hypothetical protein